MLFDGVIIVENFLFIYKIGIYTAGERQWGLARQ